MKKCSKKLLAVILSVVLVVGLMPTSLFVSAATAITWDEVAQAAEQDVDYTVSADTTVVEIKTAKGLAWVAKQVNSGADDFAGKTVKLTDNINLMDAGVTNYNGTVDPDTGELVNVTETNSWPAIGGIADIPGGWTIRGFAGTFDGQNYEVSNVYIKSENGYKGFFGSTKGSSVIKDVGVVNSHITGTDTVGGVAGGINGTVQNCYNTGVVRAEGNVGGVVGVNAGTVQDCYNTGTVSAENRMVGGVIGTSESADEAVKNCYNTGDVSGNSNVGGISGRSYVTLENCYNTGVISGADYVGGIVGYGSSVQNSYNTGDVSGTDYVGGISGRNGNTGTVQNSYNTGDVSGDSNVGGVAGGNNSGGTVQSTYYREGSASSGIGIGGGEATSKTSDDMQSPEFTQQLNDWVVENRSTISGLDFWLQETTTSYPSLKEGYLVTVADGSVSNYKGIAFVGSTVNLTPNTVEGKVFSSWTVTPNTVTITNNSFTMPSEDVHVTAVYRNLYAGIFNLNGGSINGDTQDVTIYANEDDTLVMPSQNPIMSGYTFDGYFTEKTGGVKISTATKLTQDTTYYAQWIKNALLPQNLSFAQNDVKKTVGDGKFTNTLSGIKTEVTYKSSNEDVAKVDPKTGEVTIVSAGTTSIIATATADLSYDMAAIGYKLTVNSVKALTFDDLTDYVASFEGDFDNLAKIYFNGVELTLKKINNDSYELMGYPQGSSTVIGKAERGSIIVTLYEEFLRTLPAGDYNLSVTFGGAPTQLAGTTVVNIPQQTAAPTTTPAPPTKTPETGDNFNPVLWTAVAIISLGGVMVFVRKKLVK